MKIDIYSLCPCGSGKKIKFCCGIKKVNNKIYYSKENYFKRFIKENSSKELLKIFALLQLIPENATKIIRIEELIHLIIFNYNNIDNKVDSEILKNILNIEYLEDYREDPAENCFSELIMFYNGNNIVFPGICNNSTEVNQLLLESLFRNENRVNKECLKEIENGILLNLTIHNNLAKKLGIKRYEYKEDYKGKIKFLNDITIQNNLSNFIYSQTEIDEICEKLSIPKNTIDNFSISIEDIPKTNYSEDSVLLIKPFIKIEDDYILALPSSQMYSLNYFINDTINKYEQNEEYLKSFIEIVKNKINIFCYTMGWEYLNSYDNLQIWKFDTNKIAIIYFNINQENSNNATRLKRILEKMDGYEILYLTVVANTSVIEPSFSYQENITFLNHQLIFSLYDFERLIILYNLKKLDLWNYAVALERAEQKGFVVFPTYSILSYYSWYEKNEKSFFQSDEEPIQVINFGFDVQGNKVIEALQKNDKHLVLNKINGKWNYSPVIKNKKLFPIYISDRIYKGILEQVLETYRIPIWVKSPKTNVYGNSFIDCIIYWLNEFYPTLQEYLNKNNLHPITIVIDFEPDFFDLTEEEINKKYDNIEEIIIQTDIDYYDSIITMSIPKQLFFYLNQNNNLGEQILMRKVLQNISNILNNYDINLSPEIIEFIIKNHLPYGMAKMIITGNSIYDISKDDRYIESPRRLDKAKTSIVLEDLVGWMDIELPKNISNDAEKKDICRKGINTLISKIRTELQKYNSIDLIRFLMQRHESIINSNSFYRKRLVTYNECYGKYEDVFEEIVNEDISIIRTAICLRSLIEFSTAEVYYGTKNINNSDIDFLLALIDEILFLGATIDLIESKIGNPEIGLLPSGRLGISRETFDKMNEFSLGFKRDELTEYSELYKTEEYPSENFTDEYLEKIDTIFKEDYGIAFFSVLQMFDLLAHICIEDYKTSCLVLSKKSFIELLNKEMNLTISEIDSFLKHYILESRGDISTPPIGYNYSDIFPWRFNRKLSYLYKPIILIKDKNNEDTILFSARHLNSASNNFRYALFNGILKIDSQYRKINSFLAERNNIKGKIFRKEVADYLSKNTGLDVVPYEYKIPRKGQSKDYGDIDILAFDKNKKIIYCIECKNTKLTKVIYDFSVNIQNYIEKQLPKHLNRIEWVKGNKGILSQSFNNNFDDYNVKSLLISSYQLPLKLIEDIKGIDFYSFNEIKRLQNVF